MIQQINLRALKQEAREIIRTAQVSSRGMVVLCLGLILILDLATVFSGDVPFLSTFLSILSTLIATVLEAGLVLYCMGIRRGERVEYLALFDGFSFAGKIILVSLLVHFITSMGAVLFIIPGVILFYHFRFALFNLYENPELGILEALHMSSRQTRGYKRQLLALDISYLGWSILASLPSLVRSGILYRESLRLTIEFMQNPVGVMPVVDPSVLVLPEWAWCLISGLWALAVATLYLPQRRCVDLAFFEIAKSNSIQSSAPSLPE